MMDESNRGYRTADEAKEVALKAQRSTPNNCCAREMTVGEHLDHLIAKAERHIHALRDLKASLPGTFLTSGASRIAGLSGV